MLAGRRASAAGRTAAVLRCLQALHQALPPCFGAAVAASFNLLGANTVWLQAEVWTRCCSCGGSKCGILKQLRSEHCCRTAMFWSSAESIHAFVKCSCSPASWRALDFACRRHGRMYSGLRLVFPSFVGASLCISKLAQRVPAAPTSAAIFKPCAGRGHLSGRQDSPVR